MGTLEDGDMGSRRSGTTRGASAQGKGTSPTTRMIGRG